MKILKTVAYEIIASGGLPSVEAQVTLDTGEVGTASVSYGASAGTYEASVIFDEDEKRYAGKGMLRAVNNINQLISPILVGRDATNQSDIDQKMIELDGTTNKSKLGGNAILAVSVAVARAAATAQDKPLYRYIIDTFQTKPDLQHLPQPMAVAIEGGKHASNSTDLQEYCLTAVGNQNTKESVRAVLESYHALKKILKQAGYSTNVGNEGAFAPDGIKNNELPLEYLTQAIKSAGYQPGIDVAISIDAAASEFYHEGKYHLSLENKKLNSDELISYYQPWLDKYPIVSIEDMLAEDDWQAWVKLNQLANNKKTMHIGDDLTVTSVERLQMAINQNAINAILIKLNQIGTLTETVKCCLLAQQHGLATVPSHRGGGETNDTAMVDLAVAVGSRFVKFGPTRGERVAKYNRLMQIERELDTNE
ncbi:MAG TPA: phosphopyruvate hydratase [Candidatus Woesebacteria bacterium]|nr:phosphopyruvate hydratase [Candidatus Woesebacteria bacterium]